MINQVGKGQLDAGNFILKSGVMLLALLFGSQGALAQTDGSKEGARPAYLEEVIVTAQKREENVQSVPIAISVFSGDTLDKLGIVDLQGISDRTPGFNMGNKDAASSQLSIRGIGSTDDGAAADNSVIVYVDEVPIGRAAGMDLDLFDLERVEVLRGPQGTLFGRNAVGGAVSLVTLKPTEELKIKMEATIGDLHRQDFRGLISGKVTENLFGKLAFSSRSNNGFLDSTIDEIPNFSEHFPNLSKSLADEVNAMDVDRSTMRGGLRYVPNDALEINLTGTYSTLDQTGPQRVFIGDNQTFGIGGDALLPGFRDDVHKEFFEDPGFARIDSYSAVLHVDYDFGNDYLLTSISAYRELDSAVNDVISTAAQTRAILGTGVGPSTVIAPAANDFDEQSETYTQEFRITSPGGNRFEWVAGVFFMHEDVRRNETVNLGLLTRDANNVVSVLAPPGESGDDQKVNVDSYAVFAQLSYEIMDGLDLTLGGRWTEDEKDISREGTADGIVVRVPFSVTNSASFDKFTPKVVLAYTPVDDVMVFGSFSRGFKSGGFQGRGTSEAAVKDAFGPETADSYELGMKATFFDGRFQINPTVFHTDFKDLQVVELLRPAGSPPEATSTLVTQNAADAEIDGFEVEYSFFPTNRLTFRGAATFLDAQFVSFTPPPGYESESGASLSDRVGNDLSKSPDFVLSQLVTYEWPVPALNGSLVAQAEYIHKDKMFHDVANNPDVATPAYDVANLKLTYQRAAEHSYDLSFWVKNAFNEDYLLASFAQDNGGRAIPAAPRTWGLTLLWRY